MRRRADLSAGRFWTAIAASALVSVAVGLACLFFGQAPIPPGSVLRTLFGGDASAQHANIILMQRLPRVLLGLLAGGGLAVAGAVFQALLRNPLATPHTLGVSAGGALGAVCAIYLGLSSPWMGAFTSVQFFGLLGALVNTLVLYALSRRTEVFSPLRLLLAGVTLGLVASALIMFVRFVADPQKLVMVDRWLMGGLDVHGFSSVAAVLPLFLPALTALMLMGPELNQLALGEELAAGRGVSVHRVQLTSFLAGSVLTASVVSVAGPIGFVGLIIPHLVRMLIGPDHRLVLWVCLFGGAAFLAAADTVARIALAPSELPVGVLTAMLGGPFFLFLLVTNRDYR